MKKKETKIERKIERQTNKERMAGTNTKIQRVKQTGEYK